MTFKRRTNPWFRYLVLIRGFIPVALLLVAVCLAIRTVEENSIGMKGSEEYSFLGLIKAHGYIPHDMLGPVPLELPSLVEYLYRGRSLLVEDADLFSSKVLGVVAKSDPNRRPVVSQALADAWRTSVFRQLVYNPFTYSDRVRFGEPLSRTSWPALIRLLPPLSGSDSRGSVFVTEVGGVVYFIPSEWLESPHLSRLSLFADKLIEPMLIALIWLVGWCFIRWSCGAALSLTLSVGAALPIGMGLWGVFYWLVRSIIGRSLVLGAPGWIFGVFTVVVLSPIVATRSFRLDLRRYAGLISLISSCVVLLSLGLMRFSSFVPTVDSFRLLSSENSLAASLTSGFPIVLSSIGALGVVTGQGFVGTVYPLLFISLVLITVASLPLIGSLYPTRGWSRLVAALLLVLFFALTPMALLQFSYVNGHVFTACCLLTLLMILLESRSVRFDAPTDYAHTVCVFFLALFVSMSRMEGALLNILVLASMLFSGLRAGPRIGRYMQASVGLAVVVWAIVTVLVLSGQAFVSSTQYVALSAIAVLLSLISLLDATGAVCRWFVRYGSRLMLLVSITVAYGVHVVKPAHMGVSTASVFSNMLVQNEGWGYFWWFVVAIIMVCWWNVSLVRFRVDVLRDGASRQAQRVLGVFFALGLLVTILIGLFRQPYRIGWSDSANRIIFQLVPVLVVWLYGVIGDSLRIFRSMDSGLQIDSEN